MSNERRKWSSMMTRLDFFFFMSISLIPFKIASIISLDRLNRMFHCQTIDDWNKKCHLTKCHFINWWCANIETPPPTLSNLHIEIVLSPIYSINRSLVAVVVVVVVAKADIQVKINHTSTQMEQFCWIMVAKYECI